MAIRWANGEVWQNVPRPKLQPGKAHFWRHRGRWLIAYGEGISYDAHQAAVRHYKILQPVIVNGTVLS